MFSENLKIARKRKDYTLEQLANEYNKRFGGGLSKGTLSKYENGKQEPMITVVINLAEILDVSIDFFTREDADYTDMENLVTWLMTFGAKAEVLEPKEARDIIRRNAEETLKSYGGLGK